MTTRNLPVLPHEKRKYSSNLAPKMKKIKTILILKCPKQIMQYVL